MFLNFSHRGFNLNAVTRYNLLTEEMTENGKPQVHIWFVGDEDPMVLDGREALAFINYITSHPIGVFPVDLFGE